MLLVLSSIPRPAANGRLAEQHSQRLRAALLGWICGALAALVLAVCFASFGSLRAGGPPLLLFALALPLLLLELLRVGGGDRRRSASEEAQWSEALHGEGSVEAPVEGRGEPGEAWRQAAGGTGEPDRRP